jgi:hypothetical protein
MARKQAPKVTTATAKKPNRVGRAVRLDLTDDVHKELDHHAKRRGLNKASLSRMIVMEWLERQREGKG